MKKAKIQEIVNLYQMLDNAALSKMEVTDRFAFIKILRPLKKISEEFNSFREDAVKRLRPENYDEVAETIQKFNGMTREERAEALTDKAVQDALRANGEFNINIDKCLQDELDKEVELDYTPLSESAFGKLMESNEKWNAGEIIKLEDLIAANN